MQRDQPLIPGHQVENAGRYHKTCKQCHEGVMMAKVQDGRAYRWRALESKPIDREGRRYFRRHVCGSQNQQTPHTPATQCALF